MSVNGGRVIRFNPADIGFLETLYGLVAKLDDIDSETSKKKDKTDDLAKGFDYSKAADKRKREAVDAVFGEGFCADVFQELRLDALADGLKVVENFISPLSTKWMNLSKTTWRSGRAGSRSTQPSMRSTRNELEPAGQR